MEEIYRTIPGGMELVAYLGETPTFHDGEILSLELNRRGSSFLKIHTFFVDQAGRKMDWKTARHAIVTFRMEHVLYLQLDGFSIQNVIGGLTIERVLPPLQPTATTAQQGVNDAQLDLKAGHENRARSGDSSKKPNHNKFKIALYRQAVVIDPKLKH